MNAYQQAVITVTASLPHQPYEYGGYGCPADVTWHGKRLMKASPGAFCCGIGSFIVFEALKLAGLEHRLTFAQAEELRRYAFVLGWEDKPERLRGLAGGMIDIGIADEIAWEDAALGDGIHCQWDRGPSPTSGHTLIATGGAATGGAVYELADGSRGLWAVSANTSRPKLDPPFARGAAWVETHGRKAGTQFDYFKKTKAGKDRHFNIARFKPEFLEA